ncbi:MAG: methyltransferase, partial [Bacteroidota bacterium]
MKADHVVEPFRFKKFSVAQDRCKMKVGTDGVLLGAWTRVQDHEKALDIGTGTGLIALILGQRSEQLQIVGVEIDRDSCEQAADNFRAAPWSDRLQIIDGSVQDYARDTPEQYDLIVSNPPFFTGGTISDSQDRNDVRHTIKLSHADLLRSVQKLLSSRGCFNIILPLIEGLRFIELAETYNLRLSRRQEVRPKAS